MTVDRFTHHSSELRSRFSLTRERYKDYHKPERQVLPHWTSDPLSASGYWTRLSYSHTLYLNTDWELPKTRWLDHELTPLPRPQLHAWAWSPTSSEGRQGIRVFVSSPTQGRGGWRSVSKWHPPRPSATSWITWLASRCLLCFLSFLRIESETLLQLSILLHV